MSTAADALAADVAAGAISTDNPAVADVTLDDFILDGRPMDANVREAVDDIAINRAIDGASTLTVDIDDPQGELLNSPVLAKAVDVWLDDLAFRLADLDLVDHDGGQGLTGVFEARAVARLRLFDDPLAASRADKTRAEFIKGMCDEADVPFVCPQLHKKQPIAKKTDRESRRKRDERRDPGIKKTAKIIVGTTPLDSRQLDNAGRVLDVAHSLKADDRSTLALVEACIVEPAGFQGSGPFDNPRGGDATSTGILQLLSATAAGLNIDPMDVEACANAFMTKGFTGVGGAIALAKQHPDWTPGQIAQAVQGSAFPARYEMHREEAEAVLKAYGHGDVFAGAEVQEFAVAYMFRRGSEDGATREDSWTAMRRLAAEVNWRLWEDAGTVYFMTDDDILRSRVRHTITPGAEGVDSVAGRISTRKPLQEVTVQCHARRWQAPPATVCEMEGYGRFDGRWIVATINRPSVFATATTITLHRRQKAKLEPAHDTRTRNGTTDVSAVVGNSVTGGTLRDKVVAAAKHAAELSKGDPTYYHYSQAGKWKNDLFLRDAPDERSDCSSFIIQCWDKAGCNLPPLLDHQGFTGSLAQVGKPVNTPKPGDIILYGDPPTYHHVELYVGDGKTIGHGSAPVDGDTPKDPALGKFGGYFTFDFLDEDTAKPKVAGRVDGGGRTEPT